MNNKNSINYDVTLNLIQAVRSFLYVPIYLAQDKLKENKIALNIIDPTDDDGQKIVGDAEAFTEFIESPDIHLCVCDPMMVPVCDPDLRSESVIVGGLINKVALWAMTKDDALYYRVAAGLRNIFKTIWLAEKNVVSYSRPSTAGAVAAYFKKLMHHHHGSGYRMYETENGLELQYMDTPLDGQKMDVVITADLLAHEAHYNHNKAKPLHSFAEDWDRFFFTGIITKRKFLEDNKTLIEKVLRAIKEAVVELYHYHSQQKPFPAPIINDLISGFDKYTLVRNHTQFKETEIQKSTVIQNALDNYLRSGIPSKALEVDSKSFSAAFELRKSIEMTSRSAKYYYTRIVHNDIAQALDKEHKNLLHDSVSVRYYYNLVYPYKKFWSLAIPASLAILFNALGSGSLIQIVISIVLVFLVSWAIFKFLVKLEKHISMKGDFEMKKKHMSTGKGSFMKKLRRLFRIR